MKAATISDLKKELLHASPARVTELCLRLARFKKENKELLTYLLFEEHDSAGYIKSVKNEMDIQFENINKSNVYFVKKTLRKILRSTNKFIRYSGLATTETELLIHFCISIKQFDNTLLKNPVINNIFQNQLKKIHKSVETMHEDLQYEYHKEIRKINE